VQKNFDIMVNRVFTLYVKTEKIALEQQVTEESGNGKQLYFVKYSCY